MFNLAMGGGKGSQAFYARLIWELTKFGNRT